MITSTPKPKKYGSINTPPPPPQQEEEDEEGDEDENSKSSFFKNGVQGKPLMEPFDSPSPGFLSPNITTTDGGGSHSDNDFVYHSSHEDLVQEELDGNQAILMATVLVEDAIEHRSTHHKVDKASLSRYRLYHSAPVRWVLRVTITILLLLAFFETPSSLTKTSYPGRVGVRPNLPCGATEAIEFICLTILATDLMFKYLMIGGTGLKKENWLMAFGVALVISYLDWLVSLGYGCNERWRFRRILRPFYLVQNSSLMKKTVQSIQKSLPQILSVLFLLFLQLYFFTMLGMIMFSPQDLTNITSHVAYVDPLVTPIDMLNDKNEGQAYFNDIGNAVISLVVLLTTANNPDVMMPAYSDNRLYSLYFILYLAIGLFFFMNTLLAVMFNQFKGSFTKSLQGSFMRRRIGIRAAYEVLRSCNLQADLSMSSSQSSVSSVYVSEAKAVLQEVGFPNKARYISDMNKHLDRITAPTLSSKQFQELFEIVFKDSVKQRHPCRHFHNRSLRRIQAVLLHEYFQYFGDFMSLVNVFVVTIQLATSTKTAFVAHSKLSVFNFCFIFYYGVEQVLMIVFIGPRRYFSHKNVWFESCVTWLLVLVEVICICLYGGPFPFVSDAEVLRRSQHNAIFSLFNLLRFTNMLIIIRLLRIIPSIKPLKMVASTLLDLVKNLRSFGGVLITIYYVFAVVGMMIFEGHSPQPPSNSSLANASIQKNCSCGSYEQLDYYANNFDDFAASLVVLWDVMVVNNWQVFLEAFGRTMNNRLYQLYFILWWLTSVVVIINLFIALVIEAFITQWDKQIIVKKKQKKRKYAHNEETSRHFRVHEWFRAEYQEPTEEEIIKELNSHHYLKKHISIQPITPITLS